MRFGIGGPLLWIWHLPRLVTFGAGLQLARPSAVLVWGTGSPGHPWSFGKSVTFLCQDSPALACFSCRASANREGNRVPDAAAAPVASREQVCGCCSDPFLCLLLAVLHMYWREHQSPETLYFVRSHVTFSSQGEAWNMLLFRRVI